MNFYANPYDTSAKGFYFETYKEYVDKSDSLLNPFGQKVEEFEIDVIDGTSEEIDLVNAIVIDQGNIKEVIDYIEEGNESEWPATYFLFEKCYVTSLDQAKEKVDGVCITESSLYDYAVALFDGLYGYSLPDNMKCYIDYDKFANDCEISGDLYEFEFGSKTYTCTNANDL